MNKALETAANWWFDRIVDTIHNNGDRSEHGFVANTMANILASRHPVPPSMRGKFVEAFVQRALNNKKEIEGFHLYTGCDYGPAGILADAMEDCEINFSRAPCKTNMWIDVKDGVAVSDGYGVRRERLCDINGVEPTVRYSYIAMWQSKYYPNDPPEETGSSLYYERARIDEAIAESEGIVPGTAEILEERLVDGEWVS